jgi:glucosyl-3-phosphoglycerate synthase
VEVHAVTSEDVSWLDRRTYSATEVSLDAALAAKGRTTVSVVLPARNEERTVAAIVETLRTELVERIPLIDELVVMDSGSTDATAAVAAAAGARVVHVDDALPALPSVAGKGEALWRSLAVTTGDVIAFVDADLEAFDPTFAWGTIAPLLLDAQLMFVKATFDRPLADGQRLHPAGGGRVTELVARPLLNLHWPDLAGFVQPLAGEYAGRRTLLEQLPFPCGYGVELGVLVDTWSLVGIDAMAQVDVGVRRHRHQDDQALGRMAAEILLTAQSRLHDDERGHAHPVSPTLTQYTRDGVQYQAQTADITALERPPMVTLGEYASTRAIRS